MNNLAKLMPFKINAKQFLALLITIFSFSTFAQETTYIKGNKYVIAEITVNGNTSFSEQTIITYSGLRKGSEIQIPGEEISNAIKKLWNSNLFNDIDIYLLKIEGNNAFLEIRLSDLPVLNDIKITGVKKAKRETIIKENKLNTGVKVTENLVTTTKNYLVNKYKKDGFYNAKVNINTIETKDSLNKSKINMVLAIDRGKKVKVKNIVFTGDSVLKESKLRNAMKNTKKRNYARVWKRSKFIQEDYKADLTSIIEK